MYDDAEPQHPIGLGFEWRLQRARRENLELRFEASRLDPVNGDGPEHRIGL